LDWIRDELVKRGKSQAALARHMNLDPSQVSKMLKGGRKISIDELSKIEQFLGATSPKRGGGSAPVPSPAVISALCVEVVGVVAGGVWREQGAPWGHVGEAVVPVIPDARFAGRVQKAVRVEGADLPSAPVGSYAIFVNYDPAEDDL